MGISRIDLEEPSYLEADSVVLRNPEGRVGCVLYKQLIKCLLL